MRASITPIGRDLTRGRAILAAVIALLALGVDAYLVVKMQGYPTRTIVAAISAGLIFIVSAFSPARTGLTLKPQQPWQYWLKMTLIFGAVMGGVIALVFGVVKALGINLPIFTVSPERYWPWFRSGCLWTPPMEEAMYRLVLCVPVAALLGPRSAIVVSGAVFAALHFLYGNPGLDNFIAGYVLGNRSRDCT